MTLKSIRPNLHDNAVAAKYLGVQPGTLTAWRHRGQGPVFIRVGRLVRYREEDLERWVTERAVESHR